LIRKTPVGVDPSMALQANSVASRSLPSTACRGRPMTLAAWVGRNSARLAEACTTVWLSRSAISSAPQGWIAPGMWMASSSQAGIQGLASITLPAL
jgi:hypothetical protein